MSDEKPQTIFLVISENDDCAFFESALQTLKFDVRLFDTAESFLSQAGEVSSGCVLCSLRLPGLSGLELHETLRKRGSLLPVILVARKASTNIVVQAMRRGVVGFLDVPTNEDTLWMAVRQGLTENAQSKSISEGLGALASRFQSLSTVENDVLSRMCQGMTNRRIAEELDVSIRTVEARKGRLLKKTGSSSKADMLMSFQRFRDLSFLGTRIGSNYTILHNQPNTAVGTAFGSAALAEY